MARPDTDRLLKHARRQIEGLKLDIAPDKFVCDLCLRVLPIRKATTGHYPSRKAGGGRHALQCDDCNNRLGWDIEDKAARYLAGDAWDMTVGPPGVAGVRMPVTLHEDGPSLNLRMKGAATAWEAVRDLAARSSRPDLFVCRMARPHPDALRMAILAWSYAEWSTYSGLAYTATAGALVVRGMLLDGAVPIPTAATMFFENPPKPPLGAPVPVLVVHAEKEVESLQDVDEFLGIGVAWGGKVIGILPAATDGEGTVYPRLEALHDAGKTIRFLDLPLVMEGLGFKRLDKVVVINDDASGWKMGVTDGMTLEDRERLARDDHPRRLSPVGGAHREYPPGHVEEFFMVEDTSAKIAPMPPRKARKKRKKGAERMEPLGQLGVRDSDGANWHIATHIRRVDGRPRGYAVFCGAKVRFDGTTQRGLNGIGLDGNGFVCARCNEVMHVVPAQLRTRPPAA
ncbi:MAG: hypothetical protein ABI841_05775 [Chloroflexota bacterium]